MPHPLHHLTGAWTGVARTWLDPEGDPEQATWPATIESLLGDRYVRIRYQGTCMGKPHEGEMTLGADDVEHTMYWCDSFHTGAAPMFSTGPVGPEIRVTGSYRAGPERWGWRTEYRVDGDRLVILATNIKPSGEEDRAIEVHLTRATAD